MNILGYLQKIGRALMVPVATLPAAAIMMGAGYWIDPMGWGASSPLAAFLIKAGAAIIDNMSILFAVGVAYGMSKDKDGAAALAGLVGFYVLTTLLSPGAVALIQSIPADQVPKAFSKINNQFVGILTGVIAAELYNRFQWQTFGTHHHVLCHDRRGICVDGCLALYLQCVGSVRHEYQRHGSCRCWHLRILQSTAHSCGIAPRAEFRILV
jgi:phosphotransferase system  glucose/maltose/N-acetylglucosamine-specific IIC component